MVVREPCLSCIQPYLRDFYKINIEYGYLRPVIQEVTAGHHEAWKAVVISKCLAMGMRLLRHSVPRNKPGLWQSDPLLCPQCGGEMKVISFIVDHQVIDRIIRHLKLAFHAERPPPPQAVQYELVMAAEESGEYF